MDLLRPARRAVALWAFAALAGCVEAPPATAPPPAARRVMLSMPVEVTKPDASVRDPQPLAERKRHGFAAAVALYPGCDIGEPRFTAAYMAAAPMLILVGALDDWTPAAPCERLAEAAARGGGAPVAFKVYPGAHHAFDSRAPVRYRRTRERHRAGRARRHLGRQRGRVGRQHSRSRVLLRAPPALRQALQLR